MIDYDEIHEFETNPDTYLALWVKNSERIEFAEWQLHDGTWGIEDNVSTQKEHKITRFEVNADKLYYEMTVDEQGTLVLQVVRYRLDDDSALESPFGVNQLFPRGSWVFADFRPSGLEVGFVKA